jgi:hydroxyethylthiazole kinase
LEKSNDTSIYAAEIKVVLDSLVRRHPLIHCITNPISINDCANAVLALGGKPIMAEHPDEVAQITEIADALSLNLGNITDARMKSMRISALRASELGIPSILDLVGITCSKLRLDYARGLLESHTPSIIKGNLAEIKALCGEKYDSIGIDSMENETSEDKKDACALREIVAGLAVKSHCVVMASGKTDIISDGELTVELHNGSRCLPLITGTGCMLGVIAASLLSVTSPINAAVLAALTLGVCGEIAEDAVPKAANGNIGLGSYHIALLDALSTVTPELLVERALVTIA